MVTIVAVLLALGMSLTPAKARQSGLFPWGDLFGDHRSRPRKAKVARPVPPPAAPTVSSVPLPESRPDQAPAKAADQAKTEKAAEKVPEKDVSPAASVPLPTPRPTDQASLPAPAAPGPAQGPPAPAPTTAPAESAPPAGPPPPSACRVALTDAIAVAPSIPDIHGPGACDGEDLVRLEAIVLPDQHKVMLKPAATLRCTMASEIADWVRSDVAPLANGLGSRLSTLENYGSFDCRGRNGVPGALLSEHGHANALDVHAFGLADGRSIVLPDRDVARELRENVLHSMCKRFTTVLGPGSDGYHEDHIHLDLLQRRNNYTICEWNVLDPMPATAPLMPEPRPEEAPPRQVAAESEAAKPAVPTADSAKPDAAKSEQPKSEPARSDSGNADKAKPDAERSASGSTSDSASNRTRKKRR